MYLVKNQDLVKSMVEKVKTSEHRFTTSLLVLDEVINHFFEKTIYVNLTIDEITEVKSEHKNCIFLFSCGIHNINDMFCEFIIEFNVCPLIMRCNKQI